MPQSKIYKLLTSRRHLPPPMPNGPLTTFILSEHTPTYPSTYHFHPPARLIQAPIPALQTSINYRIYSNTPQDDHDGKHSRKAGRLCRPPLVMLSISVKSSQQKMHIDYTAFGSSVMISSRLSKSRNQNSPPRIIYSRAHVRSRKVILGAAPESMPPLKDGASAAA